jgi:hypothetical protein
MSTATILEFGKNPNFGNFRFHDLERHLEKCFSKIQTSKDLESIIKALNPLIREGRFSDLEQQKLKRLRQRAYDHRRNSKNLKSPNLLNLDNQIQISKSNPLKPKSKIPVKTQKNNSTLEAEMTNRETLKILQSEGFAQKALRALRSIDVEYVMRRIPAICFWFTASVAASWFIWQQSVTLYASANFDNSIIAAVGGLLLVLGATAYFSITKSFLALLLCIYATGYEGYLIISGTMQNENMVHKQAVLTDSELVFLKEKADKEMANYKHQEKRYNDPKSKVFENSWFKKNFLTPAWEASSAAHEAFIAKKVALTAAFATPHITWLKIFYRLGLVFLCMLFVHRFFWDISTLSYVEKD